MHNGTCTLKPGGFCFTSVELVRDSYDKAVEQISMGCLPPDVEGLLQCKGSLVSHQNPKNITCCNNNDYCNRDNIPLFPEELIDGFNKDGFSLDIIWIIVISSLVTLFIISIISYALCRYRRKRSSDEEQLKKKLSESEDLFIKSNYPFMMPSPPCKPMMDNSDFKKPIYNNDYYQWSNSGVQKSPLNFNRTHNSSSTTTTSDSGSSTLPYKYSTLNSNSSHTNGTNFTINHYNSYGNFSSTTSNTTSSITSEITQQTTLSSQKPNSLPTLDEDSVTSGSGSGHTHLVQKTLAMEIQLKECIGQGRYGNVYRGIRRGENMAVKIFTSRDELSWKREKETYTTVHMRHENILGFFGADMISKNACTQLWLVTEYCPMGSLYDYLSRRPITSLNQLLKLMESIISGLQYLHCELFGTNGKAAIAHRDIKSKNILMKSDNQCCIADFGFSVIKTKATAIIPQHQIVGTKRYLAPEIFNEKLIRDFEFYKTADIYSLALVYWEMFNRTNVYGLGNEYQVPYYDLVNADPSFEAMCQVVYIDRRRPLFDQPFLLQVDENNPEQEIFESIKTLITESWIWNPAARLTALCIKRKLIDIRKL